jgi:hypothetical protein
MYLRVAVAAAGTVTLLGIGAAPAAAQARVPDTGMSAFGVTLGASIPSDDKLANGIDLGVQGEYYLSPRMSVRGKISGPWFDIQEGRGPTGTIHPIAFEGNIVHNWEHGTWHPYATGGVGWYHYGFDEDRVESSGNKFGVNLGGGAEYFLSRRDTVLGEVQVRIVPGGTHSLLDDYDTGYWTLAVGYKRYF